MSREMLELLRICVAQQNELVPDSRATGGGWLVEVGKRVILFTDTTVMEHIRLGAHVKLLRQGVLPLQMSQIQSPHQHLLPEIKM
jgi:hypothetical protein